MVTREELMSLGRPALIAIIQNGDLWPKTSTVSPLVQRTSDLVNFLLKQQEDGVEIHLPGEKKETEPPVSDVPQVTHSEAAKDEEKEPTPAVPVPQAAQPPKRRGRPPKLSGAGLVASTMAVPEQPHNETSTTATTHVTYEQPDNSKKFDELSGKIDTLVNEVQKSAETSVSAITKSLDEIRGKLEEQDKKIEMLMNMCLHIYSLCGIPYGNEPQPREFFEKRFEEYAGLENSQEDDASSEDAAAESSPPPFERKAPKVPTTFRK